MINCYGAALAAGEVHIWIERVDRVGIRHRCGVRAGNAAGNTKPAIGNCNRFAEGNHDITIFIACAAIGWHGAGDGWSGFGRGEAVRGM